MTDHGKHLRPNRFAASWDNIPDPELVSPDMRFDLGLVQPGTVIDLTKYPKGSVVTWMELPEEEGA